MASTCLSPVMKLENLEITAKPNWLELPRDITINILRRVDTVALVTSACVVCPLWWNICKEPLVWRTIDMITDNISLSYTDQEYSYILEKICYYAVDRSSGHLKDIYITDFVTVDLLLHIANSACQLRCIRLVGCHEISNEDFGEVVKKHPLLEELEISNCILLKSGCFEYIGQYCTHLKLLKFSFALERNMCQDVAFVIAKTLSELRHLTILNDGLTNDGLLAILNGCPLLESLDMRGCLHLDLDGSLKKRCIEQIKEVRLPPESIDRSFDIDDYDYSLQLKILQNQYSKIFKSYTGYNL